MATSRTSRKQWLEWAQIATAIATCLSLLIAVGLYVSQRGDAAQQQREQLATELVLHRYEDGLRQAYMSVATAYDSRNPLFELFQQPGQESGKAELRKSVLDDAGLDNVKLLVDYYEDLLGCAEQGLCDRNTIERLTGPDMRNFYCKARYVGLPELREKFYYPAYGERLERFAGDCIRVARPAPAG